MKAGLLDYENSVRDEWVVGGTAGQVVATVAQMMWARGSERALRENTLDVWYQTQLDDLQGLITKIRSDLTSLQRKCVVALVTTDVHARDIVEDLKNKGVDRVDDFNWMQQLRYYWESVSGGEDCLIRHSDAVINYGYEYMGATSRLVITPLTDRCWLTLTGSYGLKLGAAPAGPAGTGKTESSKDLAKAMAIQCVVFNCSDQIDYKMMGKLFRGLAQSGSWTCLDEFNRIDIEVLSVIAQQLLVLREGRLAGKNNINFMGVGIKLVRDSVLKLNLNLLGWRRWRRCDGVVLRRRRRGRQRVSRGRRGRVSRRCPNRLEIGQETTHGLLWSSRSPERPRVARERRSRAGRPPRHHHDEPGLRGPDGAPGQLAGLLPAREHDGAQLRINCRDHVICGGLRRRQDFK